MTATEYQYSQYHDKWAESLSDGTLDLGIDSARTKLIAAMNEVAELRYALDRLVREKNRRRDVSCDVAPKTADSEAPHHA